MNVRVIEMHVIMFAKDEQSRLRPTIGNKARGVLTPGTIERVMPPAVRRFRFVRCLLP